MKKSFLALFLISALALAIGLTACSSGEKASSEAASSEASSEAVSEASSEASAEAASEEASEASAEAASDEASEASAEAASEEASAEASAYVFPGDDPIEEAVFKYLVDEVSKDFEKADVCIPTVNIVYINPTNPDDVIAAGDFWVYNYNINGDTLENVSGGNVPGVMHLAKDGESYTVTSFDKVEDGANFEPSARELFGEDYDTFMEVYSDSDTRDELRKITTSNYVKANDLPVTQYQDYGWDPVELY